MASLAVADSIKINADSAGVAISGYDTVAYFTLGKPIKGDQRFEVQWQEARWRFATADHRVLFLRDPDRYAPRFGGFCAVGLARGHLATVDPEAWRIVENKLFLMYSENSQHFFQKDIAGTIANAEKTWQTLGVR